MTYNYDRTAAAEPMSAEDFKKEFEKQLKVGDRQVYAEVDSRFGTTSVAVTLINLPKANGSRGAEAMNNRAVFMVDFDQNPSAKVKAKAVTNLFGGNKVRAKSGHPTAVAKYLAGAINQLVKDNEPNFTHSKPKRAGGYSYDRSRNEVNPGEHGVLHTIYKYRDRSFAYATPAKHLTPFQRGLVGKLVKEKLITETKGDDKKTLYKLTPAGERALNSYRGS